MYESNEESATIPSCFPFSVVYHKWPFTLHIGVIRTGHECCAVKLGQMCPAGVQASILAMMIERENT